MTQALDPHELLRAGQPEAALALLQRQVREHAADARLRIFLFQLLCVLGQWQRARTQLEVCGELEASALAMVQTYREALDGEREREAVFAGQALPQLLEPAAPWLNGMIEALRLDAQGDTVHAAQLRAEALEQAPACPGTLNGVAFEWVADADARVGPVLELIMDGRYAWLPMASLASITIDEATDLRDLVWCSATLQWGDGGERRVLMPSRYVGSAATADGPLQLARKTEWQDSGAGLGQRMLVTDVAELGLLEVRKIVLGVPPA